ncbi:SAM-dependent DNA methyltransferase [Corynebacterium urealyticum]|uniref:site-specific DNA-methyltransferase (adenine-specific) n=1 Tax=Corynebacterium urealyticum (strain ATCC 43042 / DSM 7109) TaxID=504474 RepID=B1VGZ7_CORU7|nr:class I SAM-dependent DNA methyltransferase [Corynebacterium urealyticum]AGE36653.1 type I restriction-modification system, methyltransferase subunit [Corynebacterium urealyticum DSM 7111]QQB08284.1 SAM-dependent DNA methyltransferase [Corynebacterium urealyticum]QQC41527.1 SAM-dependent DNA methyltransferase [Corynebacterium urealyticum]QQE50151.1 SAM-dependent DNA methyltransferase [Corynebacterium urealyticum]CAQ05038.1 type I restriction-modification system, methyltransferase subunit [C
MSTAELNQSAVWNTADKFLRSIVEPEDYGDYILPMTVLRRLECILEPTKGEVLDLVEILQEEGYSEEMIDWEVRVRFGLSFYNSSRLDLTRIAQLDDHVYEALMDYVGAFSSSVRDVWDAFDFAVKMKTLENASRLWPVVKHFATIDMSLDALPDAQMGDLFEHVMYKAFDTKGKAAGAFYTPRDAIRLMVDILFASDDVGLTAEGASRTVYDPTAGTGGMLLVAARALKELNPDIEVVLAGQELMSTGYAIGKADLLIQGGEPDAIRHGDTLLTDLYEGEQFEYILSNPPFGTDWEVQQQSVKEQAKVPGSRFSHGLPSKDDGQMLFLAHVASKLMPAGPNGAGGRGAVVSNGSPLFTGAPESGPDKIRAWLLENDLVDAIIQLPTNMFYGTGISTYVWILDTNKEEHRKGFVQLIDASECWSVPDKGLGEKRREMKEPDRKRVLEEYAAFEDTEISKVLTPADLGFRDVKVTKQKRLRVAVTPEAVAQVLEHKSAVPEHAEVLADVADVKFNDLPEALKAAAKKRGVKMLAGMIDAVLEAVGVPDENAEPSVDRKGNPILDPAFSMTERIPLTEDVGEHMTREVLPFAPDVTWDEEAAKVGYEIPFKRVFYRPTPVRSLEEIDADVAAVMGRLAEKFAEVRE